MEWKKKKYSFCPPGFYPRGPQLAHLFAKQYAQVLLPLPKTWQKKNVDNSTLHSKDHTYTYLNIKFWLGIGSRKASYKQWLIIKWNLHLFILGENSGLKNNQTAHLLYSFYFFNSPLFSSYMHLLIYQVFLNFSIVPQIKKLL